MVREGRLTAEEAQLHGQRNIVTRAIGIAESVEVDAWDLEPHVGDRFLLCSDGLFNEVPEARIASTLRSYDDPTETAHELVDLANQAGGRDNITCIVVDVVDQRASGLGRRVG
jgi:PPM family protein phosphatase